VSGTKETHPETEEKRIPAQEILGVSSRTRNKRGGGPGDFKEASYSCAKDRNATVCGKKSTPRLCGTEKTEGKIQTLAKGGPPRTKVNETHRHAVGEGAKKECTGETKKRRVTRGKRDSTQKNRNEVGEALKGDISVR